MIRNFIIENNYIYVIGQILYKYYRQYYNNQDSDTIVCIKTLTQSPL